MFLFWALTPPAPPGEGGREDGEGHSCGPMGPTPDPLPSALLPPIPFWAFPSGDCPVPLCLWQLAMEVTALESLSYPESKLSLGGGLPPAWTPSSLEARPYFRSSMAPAAPSCRTQRLPRALHPGPA